MDHAHVIARPAPPLRPFIERYIGYRMLGGKHGEHRGLPSRFATFVVSIGQPIDVAEQTNPADAPGTFRIALSGLQATPATIAHDGNQEGVAIELRPTGLTALFDLPASELWDATVEMEEVERAGAELWQRLQVTPDWPGRFAACDLVLTRMLGERRVRPELEAAWHLIAASGGRISVDRLARELAFSRPYLARQFRREFGLGPKLASRVVRFERATSRLDGGESPAEVAAACGYFDQAHMNRDFSRLAGVSPAQLAIERLEEVPSLQDRAA